MLHKFCFTDRINRINKIDKIDRINRIDNIGFKKNLNKQIKINLKNEYSLKENFFDPFQKSPPNEFLLKLNKRLMVYNSN